MENYKRNSKDSAISRILENRDPLSYKQTSTKMYLAALIDDARIEKDWTKEEMSDKFKDVEIDYLLSGTYNFTVDDLVKLSMLLDIKLVEMYEDEEYSQKNITKLEAFKKFLDVTSNEELEELLNEHRETRCTKY